MCQPHSGQQPQDGEGMWPERLKSELLCTRSNFRESCRARESSSLLGLSTASWSVLSRRSRLGLQTCFWQPQSPSQGDLTQKPVQQG